jgi:hypothetical protein
LQAASASTGAELSSQVELSELSMRRSSELSPWLCVCLWLWWLMDTNGAEESWQLYGSAAAGAAVS